jgi:hypothetical protein
MGFSMKDLDASVVPVRALAASAGIQFEGLLAEVYRLHDAFGPDQKKAMTKRFAGSPAAARYRKLRSARCSNW